MFKQKRRSYLTFFSLGFAICEFLPLIAFAGEFSGKVVAVHNNTITIRLNESWIPDKDDKATFSREHPTLGTISVGEGAVLDTQHAPKILVKRTKGEGEITVGTDAIVFSQSTKRVEPKKEVIRYPDPIKSSHDESLLKAVSDNDIQAAKNAIALGANVNAALRGSTPLMIAAENEGNIPIVEVLLDSGADPNIESRKWGSTALKLAARWGHIKIVDLFLDRGVDINYLGSNIKDKHLAGSPAISHAADSGESAMVTHLIAKGANPNLENFKGVTPLYYAANAGEIESVNALLNAGVPLDQASSAGLTPLMAATLADGHWELAAYLLGVGANPNQQIQEVGKELRPEMQGMTALMFSVFVGDEKTFSTILLSGADPTIQRADGKTALDLATQNLKEVEPDSKAYKKRELIQRSLLHPDWGKQKAMEVVAKELEDEVDNNNFTVVLASLRIGVDPNVLVDDEPLFFEAIREGNLSMVKLMLEHGADPNVKNEEGVTAFHRSMFGLKKNAEVTKILIAQGANPNILPPNYNNTPLHEYAAFGHIEDVKLLLSAGMLVDLLDEDQDTPLHKAAQGGYVEIFKILLEAGADPSLKNKEGERPIDLARDSPNKSQFLALLSGMPTNGQPVRLNPPTRQEQISEASGSKTDEFDLGDLDF